MQLHQAVIDQYTGLLAQVMRQIHVGDGYNALVARHLPRGQRKLPALLQDDRTVCEGLQPDLRTFGVKQGRDGHVQLAPDAADDAESLQMAFLRAVRKVKARDVHARQCQCFDGFITVRGWPQGADYPCFSHHSFPFRRRPKNIGRKKKQLSPPIILPPARGLCQARQPRAAASAPLPPPHRLASFFAFSSCVR